MRHYLPYHRKSFVLLLYVLICFLGYSQGPECSPIDLPGEQVIDSIPRKDHTIDSLTPVEWNYRYLSPEEKSKRQWLVGGMSVVGYGTSLIILNNTWYKNYPKTSFHTFDDSGEWMQMDKVGHGWASYNIARLSGALWSWTGVGHKKATWIGGLSSVAYQAIIEALDAHSYKWGWSWADMGANLFGSGLYIGQELGWKEQRIQFKFSFHQKNYSEPQLGKRADQLYGEPWYERMLKDYNGQTYWLSFNLRSFFPDSKLPPWLNISGGYGAEGMFGGFENKWIDELGNEVNRNDIPRKRQYYLAPDIDFTRIKTSSKFLRTTFVVLNAFKCPAPTLMIDSKGKVKGYFLYF